MSGFNDSAVALIQVVDNLTATDTKLCNYNNIATDCSYNRLISVTPAFWSDNTLVIPQAFTNGLYVYSNVSISNNNIGMLVSYSTSDLPITTNNL